MDQSGEIIERTKIFLQVLKKFPEFKYLGDPILRKRTVPIGIKEGLNIGNKLSRILMDYRKITGFGRGLAAPQIGINKSVFVTFINDETLIYINPKVSAKSASSNYYRELCLSCGFIWPDVKRSDTIRMQWKDNQGNDREQEFTGFQARLIQHEYDHLLGIPNIDRAERGTIEFCTTNPLDEKLRSNL